MNSSPVSEATEAEAPLLGGRYRLQRKLAYGSTCTVWIAVDQQQGGQQVVMKHFDAGTRGSYLRETAAAMDVRHPCIAGPLDTVYGGDNSAYLAYEYFRDGTLRNLVPSGRVLELSQLLRCAEDLLGALVFLHQKKLIHCDIKPENVFVRRDGAQLHFVLGDLGSTCSLREAAEGQHRTGSPAYSAPERLHERFHFNSDLYSLGVLLFEMATGHLPFVGGPREIAKAHLQDPVPLQDIRQPFLRDFIGGLMEKDPSRRIDNATRALTMLSTLSSRELPEQLRAEKPRPTTPVPTMRHSAAGAAPAMAQLALGRQPLKALASIGIDETFQRLHVLSDGKRPWLLLESATDLVIVDATSGARVRLLPKSGPVRILSDTELAYLVESSIYRLNFATGERVLLHDRCTGALDFCVRGNRLLWRTRRSAHLLDPDIGAEGSLLIPHYLLDPRVHILSSGQIAMSSGSMNDQVSLRNDFNDAGRVIELDGPVIEFLSERTVLLAVTMSMTAGDRYAIWRVASYSQAERIDLPVDTHCFTTTPGHVFWLVGDHQVIQCRIGLSPLLVWKSPEPIHGFGVSPCHRWIATWHQEESGKVNIRLYGVPAATPPQKVAP
ncbi:MAG: serine/threonine protein kinase [Xanthomonadales bacterium]|jgi:serine/threonine protein kinase|nr:serine/threonine protein kinase [Xanthomonadales bacterium]